MFILNNQNRIKYFILAFKFNIIQTDLDNKKRHGFAKNIVKTFLISMNMNVK